MATSTRDAHRWPETYSDILDRDTRKAPDFLRPLPPLEPGYETIDISRYTSREFAELESERLWPYVWQMACREEEIPNPGDTHVYEIGRYSILVTRQKDGSIRAFHNSCLHRGRKLMTEDGCAKAFRCPFHAITWGIDGSYRTNPIGWDFPQWKGKDNSLPEVRVGTWGGFIFVNMDPDGPSLEEYISPLRDYMDRYDLENCYLLFHIQMKVRANWKVACEAFMESHHSMETHSQLLPYIGDLNSQYDYLSDNITRHISANLVPSPLVAGKYSEEEILAAMSNIGSRADVTQHIKQLPDGMTARSFVAEQSREQFSGEDGRDYSEICDAEMLDAFLHNVFPNFSIWGGFRPNIVYRWRPDGDDPDASIMDVYQLKRVPKSGVRPAPAKCYKLGADDSVAEEAPKGGVPPGFALILAQDMANMPELQNGMKASRTGVIELATYSEMRIRLQHQMIDRYLNREDRSS